MKLRHLLGFAASFAASLTSPAGVTRDSNGWTQVTPSSDSRLVYVSAAGSDTNDGLSPSTPKKTIVAADALIRDGFPDHLLLRRGDTFTVPSGGLGPWKNGRSATEPVVFSYYGTSGARPILKVTNQFIDHGSAVRNYQFYKGLDIYKSNSDPTSGDFANVSGTTAVRFVGGGANLRFEDNRTRFVEIVIQSDAGGTYTNVEFRRNIVVDAWRHDTYTTENKIQGLYLSGANGFLVEENVFDHNGWNETVANAGANQYNHNIYGQQDSRAGGIFRGNIFARAAAHGLQARSGGEIDRNLFVMNAVSFNIGGVAEPSDPAVETWPNYAHDNVVLNGRSMGPYVPGIRSGAVWGIWEDYYIQGASVDGNIVANRLDTGNISAYNGIENMDFGTNISYNWDPTQDTTNPAWPHPGDDLGDYNATIGGTNSTVAYLTRLRERAIGELPWNLTAYAAINYIRAGFNWAPIGGVYNYPGGGSGGTPAITITASDASAAEVSNTGVFTVTASPAPTSALVVNLTRSGTATNNIDYNNLPTTVTIPTSGTATLTVTPINDNLNESSETVILAVAPGTGYTGTGSATVTIADNDPGIVATAGAGFRNTAITSQTGTFTATFYATPSVANIDSVIGLAAIAPAAYTDIAASVRFNSGGTIDARNGGAYAAAASVPYSAGQTYYFRLVVNVTAKTYTIYVTPPGGSQTTLGTNYAFRTEQAGASSINYWTAQVLTPSGSNTNVANMTITTGTGTTQLLSHGTFEPDQATVLVDMTEPYTLGTGPLNKWFGRVGAAASQTTTYMTSGSNHYLQVGNSVNTNGAMQAIVWPGTGAKTLTFKYRGTASYVRVYGANTGATIQKFGSSTTMTLLQTVTNASATAWTNKTATVTLTGSYNYLVIQLRAGDFDDVTLTQ